VRRNDERATPSLDRTTRRAAHAREAARAPSSRRGGDALGELIETPLRFDRYASRLRDETLTRHVIATGELVETLLADEAFASSGEAPSGPSTRAAWRAAVARLGPEAIHSAHSTVTRRCEEAAF